MNVNSFGPSTDREWTVDDYKAEIQRLIALSRKDEAIAMQLANEARRRFPGWGEPESSDETQNSRPSTSQGPGRLPENPQSGTTQKRVTQK